MMTKSREKSQNLLVYRGLQKKILVLLMTLFIAGIVTNHYCLELEQQIIGPDLLYIGTPFYLEVRIISEKPVEVYHPVKDTVDIFTITDITRRVTQEDNRFINTYSYRLVPFQTGDVLLPSLTFEVVDTESDEVFNIKTEPIVLNIGSVLDHDDLELRDIAEPVSLRMGLWDYLIPLISLIILIAVLIVILRKISRKKPITEFVEEVASQPAHLRALEMLDRLKKKKMLEKGQYLEYYFQLSFILRYFLELHYGFNAVEMTSSEIEEKIRDFSVNEREEIGKFLTETDLVKFAKYVPFVDHALEHTAWLENYLKSFIDDSSDNQIPEPERE